MSQHASTSIEPRREPRLLSAAMGRLAGDEHS